MDDYQRYKMNEPSGNYNGNSGCLEKFVPLLVIPIVLALFAWIVNLFK